MRIAIIQFPGSNCERETRLAVKRAGMEAVEFLWNEPIQKLHDMDGYIIVGGFSYEDRSRAGIIAALDPVMQEIKLQSEAGKPVLGICNGAQILVETGLVPGLENNKVAMALTENKRIAHGKILGTGYYNDWIYMRLSDHHQHNAFTRYLTPKNKLYVPIAHAEGRFVMTEALLQEVTAQGLNVFQYCDAGGNIDDHFPVNPNGSMLNIAAVSNKAGNVMAMMPHPERTINGDAIFQSMRDYIAEKRKTPANFKQSVPLYYYPRQTQAPVYKSSGKAHECIVGLMITDNHALTVQNTLRQMGLPVIVRRYTHWEIEADTNSIEQIKQSGVLFNPRKEFEVKAGLAEPQNGSADFKLLIHPKDNITGSQKHQTLQDHFDIKSIKLIRQGILWHFTCDGISEKDLLDRITHSQIVFNPYAHDCYQYHFSS